MSAESNELSVFIAMFQRVDGGWNTVWHRSSEQAADLAEWCPSGYVRISEWERVEFKPMTGSEVIAKQVQVLNQMRAAVVQEFTGKLQTIDARRNELLAITHQAEPS